MKSDPSFRAMYPALRVMENASRRSCLDGYGDGSSGSVIMEYIDSSVRQLFGEWNELDEASKSSLAS